MQIQISEPSTITPWLLGDAKDHLRVTHSDDDGYIQLLTFAVVNIAEMITRRALFTQTIKVYYDSFPYSEIELPRPPLQSISSVKYYDTSGTLTTIDTSNYQVDANSVPGRFSPSSQIVWPQTQISRLGAVVVEYIAGWPSRGALPPALRQAMLMHLTHLYDVREAVVIGAMVAEIPWGVQMLYEPFRVVTFAR